MSSDIKNPGGRVLIKKEKYQNRATFDIGGWNQCLGEWIIAESAIIWGVTSF
jgi:hypothetical protein